MRLTGCRGLTVSIGSNGGQGVVKGARWMETYIKPGPASVEVGSSGLSSEFIASPHHTFSHFT